MRSTITEAPYFSPIHTLAFAELISFPTLIAIITTLLCIGVHFQISIWLLKKTFRLIPQNNQTTFNNSASNTTLDSAFNIQTVPISLRRQQLWLAISILGLLLAHLIEIELFALAYFIAQQLSGNNQSLLEGAFNGSFQDYFYYSAAVYTTVGFGDITPEGGMRIISAFEALTGLVLVAWTASFSFVVFQHLLKQQFQHLKQADTKTNSLNDN